MRLKRYLSLLLIVLGILLPVRGLFACADQGAMPQHPHPAGAPAGQLGADCHAHPSNAPGAGTADQTGTTPSHCAATLHHACCTVISLLPASLSPAPRPEAGHVLSARIPRIRLTPRPEGIYRPPRSST